jgi:hypothetical protein
MTALKEGSSGRPDLFSAFFSFERGEHAQVTPHGG